MTSVNSSDLEKAYLAYCTPGSDAKAAILRFQAGKHTYELDFRGTSCASLTQQGLLTCCSAFSALTLEERRIRGGPGRRGVPWFLLLKCCLSAPGDGPVSR